MNENNKEVWKRVSGWILPGLGLLTLAGVTLGGSALSLFAFLGLVCSGNFGFFGCALLLGFLVAMFGLILMAQRFFELRGSNDTVEVKVE